MNAAERGPARPGSQGWMGIALLGTLIGAIIVVATLFADRPAQAYPFMIRHGYTGCGECHVDPSGGGVMTEYGRGQSEILLRTPWEDRSGDWEPSDVKNFAFGALDLPEWLLLQADSRSMVIPEPGNFRFIQMQTDLRGAVRTEKFVASGSFGWVSEGAQNAWFTSNPTGGNLVAREYWLGFKPAKELTIRAGRMNLLFGLRSEEHLLYPRSATSTDTNAAQQTGLSLAYEGKKVRGEVMGIAGNLQVSPDSFRERGASGYAAYAINKKAEVGLSGLFGHTTLDPGIRVERTRSAAGFFARAVPVAPVVVMLEADVVTESAAGGSPAVGMASYLELDVEPTQGVHVRGTGELCNPDFGGGDPSSTAGWLGGQWFFAPHADVRLDAAYGSLYCTAAPDPQFMGLAQVHLFL